MGNGTDNEDAWHEEAWEDVQRVSEEAWEDAQRAGEGLGPAALLAASAVVAAVLFGYASLVSAGASDAWQQALRTEIKRSAALAEDVRYVYAGEAPLAFGGATVEVLAEEIGTRAEQSSRQARPVLEAEAQLHQLLFDTFAAGSPILAAEYEIETGVYDVGKRLADIRNENPDLVALDPDALQTQGDQLSRKATTAISLASLAPVAFLIGSMAQVFRRRRGLLLWAGWVLLGMTVLAAVAVQLEM